MKGVWGLTHDAKQVLREDVRNVIVVEHFWNLAVEMPVGKPCSMEMLERSRGFALVIAHNRSRIVASYSNEKA